MGFYKKFLRPVLFSLDAETAHGLAILGLKIGLIPRLTPPQENILKQKIWGLEFPNPIGLAAGFDKNAEVFEDLLRLGFGFVEVGTVTPLAQPGNDKPRMFRLAEDKAIINRLGFNNEGLEKFKSRFERWRQKGAKGIVGANVGKNKDSIDSVSDFVTGITAMAESASYLVVNVSSPNTPGLRDLQGRERLEELLLAVMTARNTGNRRPPLLLKIAPDLTDEDEKDIAEVALDAGIDGLVVTNTTIARPVGLKGKYKSEVGGLSGKPLFEPSNETLKSLYKLTEGKIPLIGVGGVSSGKDAYEKIRAGASLVQIYSSIIYEGPWLANKIKRELVTLIKSDGFEHVAEAIGADH